MESLEQQPEQNARAERFEALAQGRKHILQDLLDDFRVHARMVGKDFNMRVLFGAPFEGYFFTNFPPTVTMDPARCLLDPDEGYLAIGHEGSHRYNTYSLHDPYLYPALQKVCDIDSLSEAVGFNAMRGGIEDVAVNNWYRKLYTGAKERMDRVYEKIFANENSRLYTPEVKICEELLGTYPKFAQYLSAVIRKWHKGSWGENLDPQVERALKDTAAVVDAMGEMTVNSTGAPEIERRAQCLKRHFYYLDGVWPVVKDLVIEDLKEAGYQAFKKAVYNSADGLKDLKPQQSSPSEGNEVGEERKDGPGDSPDRAGQESQGSQNFSRDGSGQKGQDRNANPGDGTEQGDQKNRAGQQDTPGEESTGNEQQSSTGQQIGSSSHSSSSPQGSSGLLNGSPQNTQDNDPGRSSSHNQSSSTEQSGASRPKDRPSSEGGAKNENSTSQNDHDQPDSGEESRRSATPGSTANIDDLLKNLPTETKMELKRIVEALKDEVDKQAKNEDSAGEGQGEDSQEAQIESAQAGYGTEGQSGTPGDASQPGRQKGSPTNGLPSGRSMPSNEIPSEAALRDLYNSLFPSQRGGFEERGKFNLQEFEDAINQYLRPHLVPHTVPTHGERAAHKTALERHSRVQKAQMKLAQDLENYRAKNRGAWDTAMERGGEQILKLTNILRRDLKPTSPKKAGGFRHGSGASLPHVLADEARPIPKFTVMERTIVPLKRSFFFQFLADRSGSMGSHGKRDACLDAITRGTEAVSRNRQPFELAAFDTSFTILKEQNTPWTATEREAAAQTILYTKGGTNDYSAIRIMANRAQHARAHYRVLFVITDGESNDASELRKAIRECGKVGVIVVGFGIGSDTADVDRNYPNGRGLLDLVDFGQPNSFVEYYSDTIKEIVAQPHKFRLFQEHQEGEVT